LSDVPLALSSEMLEEVVGEDVVSDIVLSFWNC
jgi:hypothetical protein